MHAGGGPEDGPLSQAPGSGGELRGPSPREGFGLLLVGWALFAVAGLLLRGKSPGALFLLGSEVGALLLPTLIWAAARGVTVFPSPRLGPGGWLQTFILGAAGPAAALGISGLLAGSAGAREEDRILGALVLSFSPWVRVLLFALVPALCEELLFRGALMACLSRWGETAACLTSAATFALFHGSLQRAVPVAVLGYALALLLRRTGSLWPAVAVHALHNTLVLSLAGRLGLDLPPALFGAALSLGVFLFALAAAVRARRAEVPEAERPEAATTPGSSEDDASGGAGGDAGERGGEPA